MAIEMLVPDQIFLDTDGVPKAISAANRQPGRLE
jgi:hypothetical protein